MLDAKSDVLQDNRFALIKGLGTLLQGSDKCQKQSVPPLDCLQLHEADEDVILKILGNSDSLAVAQAMSDLKIFSHRLVDWLLSDSQSYLISDGKWPLFHLLPICKKFAGASPVAACDSRVFKFLHCWLAVCTSLNS